MTSIPGRCKELAHNPRFQSFILGLIAMTAIVMGLETSEQIVDYYATWFDVFFFIIQCIFCFEILVRVLAYAPRYGDFFKSGWNRFDFIVVGISLLPMAGPFALIARFARIIRVARIVSSSTHLRDFIAKISDSVDILVQASIVAAVFYYIYAVGGFYLFAAADPDRWAGLGNAIRTLLKLAVFQDWNGTISSSGSGVMVWFFVGSFVALNLALAVNFIAATTVDHFHDHERRRAAKNSEGRDLSKELREIEQKLADIRNALNQTKAGQ